MSKVWTAYRSEIYFKSRLKKGLNYSENSIIDKDYQGSGKAESPEDYTRNGSPYFKYWEKKEESLQAPYSITAVEEVFIPSSEATVYVTVI